MLPSTEGGATIRQRIDMPTRLEAFPTRGLDLRAGAEILWDRHQIPFIHAEQSDDVPYLIGLVHAHLRLGQMELLKRISQGRLAEMGGPLLRRVDHAIRALDLGRAVPRIIETMDDDARRWVSRYVDAINDFKTAARRFPPDLRALAIDPHEPWTLADALTLGRLASADVNWGKWAALLPLRHERGYDDYIHRLRSFAQAGTPTFGPGTPTPLDALLDVGKTGSNAFAISADRSASGAAMLAGDPHLGLPQPNIWCVLGYRSPREAAIGLTIPGVPFVLVGRNDHIAWGGTNMHSLSSILYDTDGQLSTRHERLRTRWWRDTHVRIRESPHGPVITDAPMFRRMSDRPVALRWRGHEPSDEAAAMLRLNRARTWDDFKAAFSTWSTGGQNFLFADRQGNIGQVLAVEFVAAAGHAAYEHVVSPDEPRFHWTDPIPSPALPSAFNPDQGFLVSANNTPTLTDPPIVAFGNTNDRVHRISDRLARHESITIDDLKDLQRDVYAESSLRAASAIAAASTRTMQIIQALEAWDGHYEPHSTGAMAYQLVLDRLVHVAYRDHYADRIIRHLKRGPHIHEFIREDIEAERIAASHVDRAAQRAQRRWQPGLTWGDRHRVGLTHPIGRVPLLGRRFHFGHVPTGGTSTTIHKSNHAVTHRPHTVRFGACARHVFDMADPDENHIVLLGGQDGWINSDTMLDQVDLWQRGDYIQVPLTRTGQQHLAVHTTTLHPTDDRKASRRDERE